MSREVKLCNGLYERIAAGQASGRVLYNSPKFGILALLTRDLVEPGHVLVVPYECKAEIDSLSEQAHTRLFIASRYVGIVIGDALHKQPNDRIAMLGAGLEIAHAHLHRFIMREGDGATPMRRFAHDLAFVELSAEQRDDDLARLRKHLTPELVAAMETELAAV
jgi:diadenosine tetraphosphate (Ap4A) HIT family hydrolase